MVTAKAYGTMYLLAYVILSIRNYDLSGTSVKNALKNIPRNYYCVTASREWPFSKNSHDAVTANMLVMEWSKTGRSYLPNRKTAHPTCLSNPKNSFPRCAG